MFSHNLRSLVVLFVSLALSISVIAADKSKSSANEPSYELPQPQQEALDLNMYQRIRIEGLDHSHVMEYASALDDDIGPRLTGSANLKHSNEWTRDQFTAMGCSNAHLEDWGEFGMGWQQLNTWVRMTSPDPAVFIAQAAPWSPSTNGAITAAKQSGSTSTTPRTSTSTRASWPERLCSLVPCAMSLPSKNRFGYGWTTPNSRR